MPGRVGHGDKRDYSVAEVALCRHVANAAHLGTDAGFGVKTGGQLVARTGLVPLAHH